MPDEAVALSKAVLEAGAVLAFSRSAIRWH